MQTLLGHIERWLAYSQAPLEDCAGEKEMKWNNLLESIIDVGSGFILAILIQLLIFPLFGLHPTILDSLGIALIFTVVSMTRSWLWRCYFRRKQKYEPL